jgi:hypothetical protein
MTLYFAYGSNLNKDAMRRRCHGAKAIGPFTLEDSALVFRGVADCIYEKGAKTDGAIWKITPECEETLDIYEGVSRGMYRKEYVQLTEPFEGENELMLYVMNSTGIYPPSQGYLDTIVDGYKDFDLPLTRLKKAVKSSWENKHPSHIERRRHQRNGRPLLGLSKTVC